MAVAFSGIKQKVFLGAQAQERIFQNDEAEKNDDGDDQLHELWMLLF